MEVNISSELYNRFDVKTFLKDAVANRASDIHFRLNSVPLIRKDGLITKEGVAPLTENCMSNIVDTLVPGYLKSEINKKHDMDFSVEIPNLARFRVNLLHEMGNVALVLRVIPTEIPSFDDLYLPPSIKNFTHFNNGLVLITGPTGSGKTTTLASILNYINKEQQKHIVTLEDPIEFIHKSNNCIFTQRQLGTDTDTFPNGVKYSLRQDPDIILIGEMRDRETIMSALKAAETGHLVFSTLHTTNAVKTIYRIINAFEPHEREQIRLQIASTLQATVAQKLVKRTDDNGRVPATEILTATSAVKDYIEKNEIEKINELIKDSSFDGMMTLNQSLCKLVEAKLITKEEAIKTSDVKNELEQLLKGSYTGSLFD